MLFADSFANNRKYTTNSQQTFVSYVFGRLFVSVNLRIVMRHTHHVTASGQDRIKENSRDEILQATVFIYFAL